MQSGRNWVLTVTYLIDVFVKEW